MNASLHLPLLVLRRHRAGELPAHDASQLEAHLASCEACRQKAALLEAEQAAFEQSVPFERFQRGVEAAVQSAQRLPGVEAKGLKPRLLDALRFSPPHFALAAACLLLCVVGVGVLRATGDTDAQVSPFRQGSSNRLKGGAEVTLRIAAENGETQRDATSSGTEALAPGERIRIGVARGPYTFLAALSLDAEGTVTPLYPATGGSLSLIAPGNLEPTETLEYLPESLEFEGQGLERVIVVLSDRALSAEELEMASRAAYDAAQGDLARLPSLAVPGEQFHQLLLKP